MTWTAMSRDMRHAFLPFAALVALVELVTVTFYLATCIRRIWIFNRKTDDFERFDSMRDLMWNQIPHVATFSALQSFYYVHPSLVGEMFDDHLRDPHFGKERWWALPLQVFWFVFSRIGAFCLGMLAFCVKIVVAGAYFQDDRLNVLFRIGFVASFLYQMLMIVLIDVQYNQRILRMFFAGADNVLDDWERDQMRVYQVRVVQRSGRVTRAGTGLFSSPPSTTLTSSGSSSWKTRRRN